MSKQLYHNRLIVPTCAVAASVALCAWLGCQDSSLAKVERERQQSVERSLKALDEREARALKSLLKTQRELDRQLRRDAAALRTDFAELDRRAKDVAQGDWCSAAVRQAVDAANAAVIAAVAASSSASG